MFDVDNELLDESTTVLIISRFFYVISKNKVDSSSLTVNIFLVFDI